jgi:hypothetical protein
VRAVLDAERFVEEMNEKYAVVCEGGKARVIREIVDQTGGTKLDYIRFDDFRNFYRNELIEITSTSADGRHKVASVPAGKYWLEHPNRRTYERVVFKPGSASAPDEYNLWHGWGVEAKPSGSWSLLDEHIRHNICRDNERDYRFLLGWMAYAVQRPDEPGHCAVVIRGEQGTGKGAFAHAFGKLFGAHYLQIADGRHLTGHFNAHLRNCCLLFCDEAFWHGDRAGNSALKKLITEPTIEIEPKGFDLISVPNHLHILMASNSDWVIPAGHDERRYFCLEISSEHKLDSPYFEAIRLQLEAGGYERMLWDLQHMDLTGFDVRNPPATDALRMQKMYSYEGVIGWWFQRLWDGEMPAEADTWPKYVIKSQFTEDFVNWESDSRRTRRARATALALELPKCTPKVNKSHKWLEGDRENVPVVGKDGIEAVAKRTIIRLPSLKACRDAFDAFSRQAHPWPRAAEE